MLFKVNPCTEPRDQHVLDAFACARLRKFGSRAKKVDSMANVRVERDGKGVGSHVFAQELASCFAWSFPHPVDG